MSAIARFLAKVDLSGGPANCQEWTAARTPMGYGVFGVSAGKLTYAHRFILGFLRGRPLDRGEWALHRCDNPPCVNPLHLYVGTPSDNLRDAYERGQRVPPAPCGAGTGGYQRHRRDGEEPCRACHEAMSAYNRANYAARRAAQ